jgi:hypothetical protein
VQRASRHDLVRALAARYGHVSKHEKGQILDQVCEVTGYTRKYALTLLTDPPPDEPKVKQTRRRLPSYGADEVELLRLCWLVTDGICSKRLAPFLPELLDRLRRRQALREFPVAVQTHVAGMSAATIDRALKSLREQSKARRGISTTKAGTLLKRQIAIRTFADWTDARPGFFEMDLVAHCGWSGAGQFLYTLSMVDVATGWVACAGLRDKRQETVFHALERLQSELPFRILGLDSDNGTEFINRAAGLLHRSRHHLHPLATVPQERHLPCRTEELGRSASPGRLRPPGVAGAASTRAHSRSGPRLHQLPASRAQTGQ